MEKVREFFRKDMFAASCGIEIVEVRAGYAKCAMEITERHLNAIGIVMGGAVFTLADFTFSVAANSRGVLAVSSNSFITYLHPCTGGVLTAISTETARSGRMGTYQVTITDGEGKSIASVTGTCYFKNRAL